MEATPGSVTAVFLPETATWNYVVGIAVKLGA
jgi:hypothetical protein